MMKIRKNNKKKNKNNKKSNNKKTIKMKTKMIKIKNHKKMINMNLRIKKGTKWGLIIYKKRESQLLKRLNKIKRHKIIIHIPNKTTHL